MRAVDVHGFAGGFTLGVVQTGFELVGKHEGPEGFGAPLVEGNRRLLGDGWRGQYTKPAEWSPLAKGVNLVFGNPPCSGFSGRSNNKFRGVDSEINHCMWDFVHIAARYAPEIAIFESVQPAYKIGRQMMLDLRAALERDTHMQYDLYHTLHSARSVGGHANRRRYFWVVSRIPFGIETPRYPALTTNELLTGFPEQELDWEDEPNGHVLQKSPSAIRLFDLAQQAGERWAPGEKHSTVANRLLAEDGHIPESWYRNGIVPANQLRMHSFNAKRLRGDIVPPVIDGGAMSSLVHPFYHRPLTFRETATLMGFPLDWNLLPCRERPSQSVSWFGKGITVGAGRWIAGWAKAALEGQPGSDRGTPGEAEREWVIDVTRAFVNADS